MDWTVKDPESGVYLHEWRANAISITKIARDAILLDQVAADGVARNLRRVYGSFDWQAVPMVVKVAA